MIQTSLLIQMDAVTMKDELEALFCEAFACQREALFNHPHTSILADGKRLIQTLLSDQDRIVLDSVKEKDRIKTLYQVTPKDDHSCTVTLSESAESDVKSRQLNYVFFSLPVVNLFTKKRLKRKLLIIKAQVENRSVYADH